MSESTPSVPARIRSRTASIPWVNSASFARPTMRRRALEAVGRAERLVEVRTVPLAPLEIHQPLLEADQELARFLVEHLAESVVRTIRNGVYPSDVPDLAEPLSSADASPDRSLANPIECPGRDSRFAPHASALI